MGGAIWFLTKKCCLSQYALAEEGGTGEGVWKEFINVVYTRIFVILEKVLCERFLVFDCCVNGIT